MSEKSPPRPEDGDDKQRDDAETDAPAEARADDALSPPVDEAADGAPEEAGSGDKDTTTEVLATDPDPVQFGAIDEDKLDGTHAAADAAADDTDTGDPVTDPALAQLAKKVDKGKTAADKPAKRGFPWFGLFNFLLIVALAAAAGYDWNERQQRLAAEAQAVAAQDAEIARLETLITAKADAAELQSGIAPLKSEVGALERRMAEIAQGQQALRESSEKLYELYGRDRNDWKLAEVEYLMRVAQHKLILQDDFEGAAITLQAASDRIGLTGDPGLLPVRVMISEEIADLRTRRRADLVGMTLKLAQLGRQARGLTPGFALRVEDTPDPEEAPESAGIMTPADGDWLGQFNAFVDSLVTVRRESSNPTEIEANIVDVAEALEDNLKLARWSVLERDARQYQLVMDRSVQLFREFYDLDNAANQDFMSQLLELQKMELKPEKPDITGSLREMQRILSQRENAPETSEATEASDG